MNLKNFQRWFNKDFWRAFKNRALPIDVPTSQIKRKGIVEAVFKSIQSARYAPSIPEAELTINKGHGVARSKPVFCVEDYIVYFYCIKELEEHLCGNRTENTFGGWTLGGQNRRLESTDIESQITSYGRYSFNPKDPRQNNLPDILSEVLQKKVIGDSDSGNQIWREY